MNEDIIIDEKLKLDFIALMRNCSYKFSAHNKETFFEVEYGHTGVQLHIENTNPHDPNSYTLDIGNSKEFGLTWESINEEDYWYGSNGCGGDGMEEEESWFRVALGTLIERLNELYFDTQTGLDVVNRLIPRIEALLDGKTATKVAMTTMEF
jgi:hypothetical protein